MVEQQGLPAGKLSINFGDQWDKSLQVQFHIGEREAQIHLREGGLFALQNFHQPAQL